MADDSVSFSSFSDLARKFAREEIEAQLETQDFDGHLMSQWSSSISDAIVKKLQALEHPFKYIVNVTILQRIGAGYNSSSACLWDARTDGSVSVRWENDTMYCIVAIHALAV